jgi:tetratricopeptide (TPR) repeat protein
MDGRRLSSWWWLVAGGVVAVATGLFAFVDDDLPWFVLLGFAAGCASPAVPFVARWWQESQDRQVLRQEVLESSVARRQHGGPSSLLAPDRQVVPFQGRAVELDGLVRWCQGKGPPVRLITGPGGVGKSRLAAELAARMTRQGWECVAVGEDNESTILGRVRGATDKPILLVVDYADTRRELDDLVRQVATDPADLRVLLIARSAGEWWQRLTVGSPQVREMIRGAYDGADLPVRIDSGVTDQEIVREAAVAFAERLGVPAPEVELSGQGRRRGNVLDLHAASLVAVLRAQHPHTGDGQDDGERPPTVDVPDVLADLLGHEQRHWIGTADQVGLLRHGPDGLTVELLRRVVAATYLAPPADEAEARALLARVDPSAATPKVLRWLRDLYPPRDAEHWVGTLQPDRMAELHLVKELAASTTLASALLDDLDGRNARLAVAVLARAAADHFSDQDIRAQAVNLLDRTIAGLSDDLELLRSVAAVFPYPSVALTRSHLSLLHRILDLIDPDDDVGRAWVLHDIGRRLSSMLGRHAEAIGPLTEAVATRRTLAQADPAQHEPHLAASLRTLGVVLSELGRPHDALGPTEEAVAIWRRLSRTDPHNRAEYARTLCYLGTRYYEAGQADEAVPPLRKSLRINEHLAEHDPERTNPHLARSLMNLAIALNMLDRPDEALPHIERAVEIRRALARDDPDGQLLFLARALTELTSCLVISGRPQDAIEPGQEAVEIRRQLTETNPERHTAGFGLSLRQTAAALRYTGRTAAAAVRYHEAIAIERGLLAEHPNHPDPGPTTALAESLSGYAAMQLSREHPSQALAPAREAARLIGWRTDGARPEDLRSYARSLSSVLTNIADVLDANGHTEQAQAHRREAVSLLALPRQLHPDVP